MKIKPLLTLSFRFLRSKFWQFFFVFLGTTVGTALFLVFLTMGQGIYSSLHSSLTVDESIVSLQGVAGEGVVLDTAVQHKFLDLPGVISVHEESTEVIPFTFGIPLPWVDDVLLDLYFLRGVDPEVFGSENNPFEGADQTDAIPVVINPLSLDLINSLLSAFLNDISLSKDMFLGTEVSVHIGKSSFLPSMNYSESLDQRFVVSGFSPLAPLVGVMMPLEEYENIKNSLRLPVSTPTRLHLRTDSGVDIAAITELAEENTMVILEREKVSEKLFQMTDIIQWTLIFSAGSIVLLSLLFLFSVLQVVLKEHQKNIGILQAMGASLRTIWCIFGLQGIVISVFGVGFGVLMGCGILMGLQWWWDTFVSLSLFPSEIFAIDPFLVMYVAVGIITFSFLPIFLSLKKPLQTPVLSNILGISS